MKVEDIPVDEICDQTWEELGGGERRRHCTHCEHSVHNLSAMSPEDASTLIAKHADTRLCVSYEYDERTQEIDFATPSAAAPPDPLLRLQRMIAGAAVALPLATAACDDSPDAAKAKAQAPVGADQNQPGAGRRPTSKPATESKQDNPDAKNEGRVVLRAYAFGTQKFPARNDRRYEMYHLESAPRATSEDLEIDFDHLDVGDLTAHPLVDDDIAVSTVGLHEIIDRHKLFKKANLSKRGPALEKLTEIRLNVPESVDKKLAGVRCAYGMFVLVDRQADKHNNDVPVVGVVFSPHKRMRHYGRLVAERDEAENYVVVDKPKRKDRIMGILRPRER